MINDAWEENVRLKISRKSFAALTHGKNVVWEYICFATLYVSIHIFQHIVELVQQN